MAGIQRKAEIIFQEHNHLEMTFEFTEYTTESTENSSTPKVYWRTVSFDSEEMREPFLALRTGHVATVETESAGELYHLIFEDEDLSLHMYLRQEQLRGGGPVDSEQ